MKITAEVALNMDWGKNFVLLETLREDKDNSKNFLFAHPVDIITCYEKADLNKCFQKIDAYLQKGFYLAGFLSYELGYLLEDTLEQYQYAQDCPFLWLGVYNKIKRLSKPIVAEVKGRHYLSPPVFTEKLSDYKKKINKIKELIRNGETYQINYTSSYKFDFWGDIYSFYAKLKENQEVSYASLINYGGNCIISLSPELFFRIDRNRHITVKPMKGTAAKSFPRGWLSGNEKNIAENVMIVDLLRNDLGRICNTGTVKVKRLFEIEEYETLWQMTSTVRGQLQPQVKIFDVIKSLFPCGSVTGAPKINSMKIINFLEKEPRNVYTGAIGYFSPNNEAVFNVAIRTIDLQWLDGKRYAVTMGIGGGIVYDSLPQEEYQECKLKAQFLVNSIPDFSLIETMLCVDGRIKYQNMHLKRLKKSAQYFSISCNVANIKMALKRYVAKLKGRIRLRLLLNAKSGVVIEHATLVANNLVSPQIAVSKHKTNSQDPFLYHKTTLRKLYDSEHKKYSAQGYLDVIFCNEKKEITEGAISNIFIRGNGCYYTPSLKCGLLNGIQRQITFKKFKAKEKVLYLKDLKKADKIILTNVVRGETEAIFK